MAGGMRRGHGRVRALRMGADPSLRRRGLRERRAAEGLVPVRRAPASRAGGTPWVFGAGCVVGCLGRWSAMRFAAARCTGGDAPSGQWMRQGLLPRHARARLKGDRYGVRRSRVMLARGGIKGFRTEVQSSIERRAALMRLDRATAEGSHAAGASGDGSSRSVSRVAGTRGASSSRRGAGFGEKSRCMEP